MNSLSEMEQVADDFKLLDVMRPRKREVLLGISSIFDNRAAKTNQALREGEAPAEPTLKGQAARSTPCTPARHKAR